MGWQGRGPVGVQRCAGAAGLWYFCIKPSHCGNWASAEICAPNPLQNQKVNCPKLDRVQAATHFCGFPEVTGFKRKMDEEMDVTRDWQGHQCDCRQEFTAASDKHDGSVFTDLHGLNWSQKQFPFLFPRGKNEARKYNKNWNFSAASCWLPGVWRTVSAPEHGQCQASAPDAVCRSRGAVPALQMRLGQATCRRAGREGRERSWRVCKWHNQACSFPLLPVAFSLHYCWDIFL